jgi:hypothetical protein
MSLFREPLVWFVVMAFSSLIITLLLFRVVKSSARIGSNDSRSITRSAKGRKKVQASNTKTKEYLLTGGVAGFIFVFFTSWYFFTPLLKGPLGPRKLNPLHSIEGFQTYSDSNFAISMPSSYQKPMRNKSLDFRAADDSQIFRVIVTDNVPTERFGYIRDGMRNPEEMDYVFKQFMPSMKFSGGLQNAPHQGHEGFLFSAEGSFTEYGETQPKQYKLILHFILDEKHNRLYQFAYDDSDQSKQMMSTLNINNDDEE